nr:hypothetical protein [Tanacetum cinerariifolium]
MVLTFTDTHNMIAYLTKSDASEGFNQIIDFFNASSIQYALTVNPNIYVSCIKQFWSSVSVKKVNDVMRIQALIDRKKVIITEATVRKALRLGDVESIDCLPNEEIFTELARMGYEKPSTKLTFYKAFFLAQWNLVRNVDSSSKFYMYLRFLQLMIRAQVSDLSSHTTKYSSLALIQKVFANMRRVGKGFSGVETPLFEGMIVTQQTDDVADEVAIGVDVDDVPAADGGGEGIIADIDADKDATLEEVEVEKTFEVEKDAYVQGRPEESQAQIYKIDIEHANKVLMVTAAATITAAAPITAATITAAPSATRRRKGVVIRDPEETATPSTIIHSEPKSKDKGKGIMVQRKEKEDNVVLRYQALKRKPLTEAQAKKNMMVYLKNMAGFKMDYFKGMSYDDIHPIFEKYFNSNVALLEKSKEKLEEEESRALKRKTESHEEKAVKKQKLDEEVEELKKHLQIVPNDDDDVYTEATPFDLKALMILLAERRYPLTRFTLDQMLNNVRLEVEEESKVSLELLRVIRQQQQEVYRPEYCLDTFFIKIKLVKQEET